MEGTGDDDHRALAAPAVGLRQVPAHGGGHDRLTGVGGVGVEDLAPGVQAGQGRPGQGVGEEAAPGAYVGGVPVLEELLPDLVVVPAAQAPGQGVQGGGAGQVVLGLQGAYRPPGVGGGGTAVNEGGPGTVPPGPAQGDPLRGELGQRVVGGGVVGQ